MRRTGTVRARRLGRRISESLRRARRISERYTAQGRCYRRLNEGVLDGMTVTQFRNLSRGDQLDTVLQFCEENGLHFDIVMDPQDYIEDGEYDDVLYNEAEFDELSQAVDEIVTRMLEVLVDDYPHDARKTLFNEVLSLDLPEDKEGWKIISVYDTEGIVWPEPPASLRY